MPMARVLLAEWDHEMRTTRTLLERIPAERGEWKPHRKSMALGQLGMHISNLPYWAEMAMRQEEYDLDPPDGEARRVPDFTTTEALLEFHDRTTAAAREAIAEASDSDFRLPWSLKNHGEIVFTLPRIAVLRSMVMNHMIHHRGQLTVYLRLNDVPLPAIYGPSADIL